MKKGVHMTGILALMTMGSLVLPGAMGAILTGILSGCCMAAIGIILAIWMEI